MTATKTNGRIVESGDELEKGNYIEIESQNQNSFPNEKSKQDMEEWKLRKNMENCAVFIARMLKKYGNEVLTEMDASNEKAEKDTPGGFV
ncbi:MAG: hypothetical protein LIO76_10510 [Clostridiales bacterium]|nr:hypothetical protein [Clostridiales bacterium]